MPVKGALHNKSAGVRLVGRQSRKVTMDVQEWRVQAWKSIKRLSAALF
jgi:hypothetical protein